MSYIGPAPASSVIGTTDIGDNVVTSPKLATTFFTGATDIGANIADADLFLMDDGAGGTIRKSAASRIKTYAGTDLTAIADGSVSAPSLANSGDNNTGVFFPATDSVGITAGGVEQFRFGSNPIPGGDKNLIHNSEFTVSQRGTATSPGNGVYLMDRWKNWQTTGGAVTVTQDTSGIFAAFGTKTSMKIDVTTAESSVAAADRFVVAQPIEAQNLQHLKYGTAAAEAVTVSFGFRSPKSGTHYVAFYQADGNRYCWRPFTVDSANTAQLISLTFAGDASGTINNDTGIGMFLYFPLMAGSNFEGGSDNTWAADERYGAATIQNLLDNTSNDIYIGRVQMEVGSVATDFVFEDLTTAELKCWRYYRRITQNTGQPGMPVSMIRSDENQKSGFPLIPPMRAAPSLETSGNADDYNINHGGGNQVCDGVPALIGASTVMAGLRYRTDGGVTAGGAGQLEFLSGTATGFLAFNAEL